MKKINLKYISIIIAFSSLININELTAAPNAVNSASALKAALNNAAKTGNNANQGTGGNISNNQSANNGNNNNNSNPPKNEYKSSSGYTIKVFDPFLDNHLKAPPDGIRVGKFGLKIKDVETQLREMGAKNHSYAFGKYSKMILSSYLITLSFDVNKRLGMVEVEPKPPLKTVEPKAREFFIKYFTEGADLSQIAIWVNPEVLELKFINPY